MTEIHHHKGQCHCGNIHFIFETAIDIPDLTLRRCDCSFCRKQGGRYTSDPGGKLSIQISDEDNVSRYHFGHKTANFILCKTCGGFPFVTSEIDGNVYAVLNVNYLDRIGDLRDNEKILSYGTEDTEIRLTRRKKNWIGTIIYQ